MSSRRAALALVAAAVVIPAQAQAAPPAQAGPAVGYTDDQYDAYTTPVGGNSPPNPALSDASLDVTHADYAPGARKGTYTVSLTLTGVPAADNTYVSAGRFQDGSTACQGFHFLYTGKRSFVNFFCDDPAGRTFIGSVASDSTTTTGNTVTAVFSSRSLPSRFVAAGATFAGLFGWSCPIDGPADDPNGNGCSGGTIVDRLSAPDLSYRTR